MKFRIQTTSGDEVVFAGHSQKDKAVYYGAAPKTGLWRISIPTLEDFIASALSTQSFGNSIEEFCFGFEIGELAEWGEWFTSTREYMSHRPKQRTFISVGQLEWKTVKDLSASEQLALIGDSLVASIERISTAKRKPKDFDHMALAQAVRSIMNSCTTDQVGVPV